ncbi:MAG: hypothetical protein WBP66_08445 [Azonexus sp.]|jgi:hypothetical protein
MVGIRFLQSYRSRVGLNCLIRGHDWNDEGNHPFRAFVRTPIPTLAERRMRPRIPEA